MLHLINKTHIVRHSITISPTLLTLVPDDLLLSESKMHDPDDNQYWELCEYLSRYGFWIMPSKKDSPYPVVIYFNYNGTPEVYSITAQEI